MFVLIEGGGGVLLDHCRARVGVICTTQTPAVVSLGSTVVLSFCAHKCMLQDRILFLLMAMKGAIGSDWGGQKGEGGGGVSPPS